MNQPLNVNQATDNRSGNGAASSAQQRPSFAEEVQGQQPKGIDMTLAKLLQNAPSVEKGNMQGVDGWKPLTDEQLAKAGIDPKSLYNDTSGFRAVIYSDGQGRHVLAFRGTSDIKDWMTNLRQGLGFEDAQYQQAISLAKQAKIAFGQDLVLAGHSLGGGLAATAAAATDTPAVTFNAAGVHDKTLKRNGLDPDAVKTVAEQGLIRRYAVKNEILTELQEDVPGIRRLMPNAIGHKIDLPDPDPQGFWKKINPYALIKHGIEIHQIGPTIEAMEKKFGKDFGKEPAQQQSLADPRHPVNSLYQQSLESLREAAPRNGLDSGRTVEQLAGALAAAAAGAELQRIDKVVFSEDGRKAYAVQGDRPESQRVVPVEIDRGSRMPLTESSAQAASAFGARQEGQMQEQALASRAPSRMDGARNG
jgi:hypothetical protein